MNFLNLDTSILLMKGRSTAKDRLAAWLVSVIAILAFVFAFIGSPGGITSNIDLSAGSMNDYLALTLQILGGIVLISTFQKLLFPYKKTLSTKMRKFTPIGFIENKDQVVINRAYNEVMDIACKVDFREAISLAQYEPSILSFSNLRVIAAHKQGNLGKWISNEERLLQSCNFLYLCHIAELRKEEIEVHGQTEIF